MSNSQAIVLESAEEMEVIHWISIYLSSSEFFYKRKLWERWEIKGDAVSNTRIHLDSPFYVQQSLRVHETFSGVLDDGKGSEQNSLTLFGISIRVGRERYEKAIFS